jgi:hypothetical protein
VGRNAIAVFVVSGKPAHPALAGVRTRES